MEKQQGYGTLIKNLPIGFSVVDKEGAIVDFNQSAENITGYLKNAVWASPISGYRWRAVSLSQTYLHTMYINYNYRLWGG